MPTNSLNTVQLHQYVKRWQDGDRAAADELLRAVGGRLERLTRKMLHAFPNVRAWAETGDVFQASLLRLLNTLLHVRPESTRHFFNLAALHVRRELLSLARHVSHRGTQPLQDSSGSAIGPGAMPEDNGLPPEDLELWCRFHEAVEDLPEVEREVLSLVFYHGWSQVQVAEIMQVSDRTVRRHWQAACLHLNELLGGELPPT